MSGGSCRAGNRQLFTKMSEPGKPKQKKEFDASTCLKRKYDAFKPLEDANSFESNEKDTPTFE